MAFDGITVSALVAEIDDNLKGGRINKIAQPENDELLITGKGSNGQKRLLLSASASLPLIYFTDKNRISPLTAPNFCMLLRKHIGSARILDVKQPGMERVVEFELEHLDTLEYNGQTYMAFFPAVEGKEDGSVEDVDLDEEYGLVILKVIEADGEEQLSTLDSEEELELVYQQFMESLFAEEDGSDA